MKCIHCGAEVEKHTFCMYCGKRLIEQHVTAKPVRAASGVMRFRQRASVSESALPEVQKRQQPAARMDLESLKRISSENDRIERRAKQPGASVLSRSTESPTVANASSDASTRQSRELEALLQKLNAPENNFDPEDMLPDIEDEFSSLEVDMDSPSATNANLSDSFFIADESEAATSGPMPTGSGTFARTPSGGFHLVIDTVKNAFKKTAQRAKRFASDVRSGDISKQKVIGASAICLCAVGAIGLLASALGGSDSDSSVAQAPVAELASQSGVAGNENFAIIPIDDASDNYNDENIAQMYDFDEDAFAIPELGDDEASDAPAPIDQAAIAAAAAAAQGAIAAKPGNGTAKPVVAAVAQAETTAKTAKSTNLTEKTTLRAQRQRLCWGKCAEIGQNTARMHHARRPCEPIWARQRSPGWRVDQDRGDDRRRLVARKRRSVGQKRRHKTRARGAICRCHQGHVVATAKISRHLVE